MDVLLVIGDEDIVRSDVPVNNLTVMKMVQGLEELPEDDACDIFRDGVLVDKLGESDALCVLEH